MIITYCDHHILYVISAWSCTTLPYTLVIEMCSAIKDTTGTEVSPSTLCKLLAKHGFTRKKVQHVARQRSLKHRAAFIAEISYFPKEMLVWVDKTGCDKRDMLRKFGYAFQGERAVCHRWLVRGRRVSAIGALAIM